MKGKLSRKIDEKIDENIYNIYIQNEMKYVQNMYKIYIEKFRTGRKFVRKMSADASLIPEFLRFEWKIRRKRRMLGNRSKSAQLLEHLQPGLVPCVDDDGELPTIAEVKIRRDVAVDGAALVAVGVTIRWLDLDDLRLCKQKKWDGGQVVRSANNAFHGKMGVDCRGAVQAAQSRRPSPLGPRAAGRSAAPR